MTTAEDIKSKTDLVQLIGQTVKLKKAGQEYFGLCPFHNDTKPSLSVNAEKQAWHCHGCDVGGDCFTWVELTQKMGFEEALNILRQGAKEPEKRIVATYPYHDADGKIIYEVVRYEPKGFAQRQPDGKSGYIWNLKGITPVLYHLPEIMRTPLIETIYHVEGEKCADALWAMGQVATTSPGGAGNWRSEYAKYLKDRRVVIIPDNDPEGFKYGRQVAKSLQGIAKEVKVVILPGLAAKEDVIQWIERGGFVDDLLELERDVSVLFQGSQPNYSSEGDAISWWLENGIGFIASDIRQERTGVHAKVEIYGNDTALSWGICNTDKHEDRTRLANASYAQMDKTLTDNYSKEQLRSDLDKFCLGLWDKYLSHFMPELMSGDETENLLRFLLKPYILEGGGTILFAPSGRGKSYTALLWAVSIDAGISTLWPTTRAKVLFINLERSGKSLKRRLAAANRILGLEPTRPLLTLNARGKALYNVLPICKRAIKEHDVKLVILDSISRAGYGDLTENRPVNAIIDALSGLCESWWALAHTPRANEDHVYGGIHFEAGADIVVQLMSQQGKKEPWE